MQSACRPAPPLSLRGAWRALRPPTWLDLLLAVKATVAMALALLAAFSLDLQNPYWSALTVFVLLAQPEASAIRSRSLYRLAGTGLGGATAIVLPALLGDEPTRLLIGAITAMLLASFAKNLDRTPKNYLWFTAALTVAVVTVEQVSARGVILDTALTRMAEIALGVLATGLVDSLIAPRAATPAFLAEMSAWRDRMAKAAIHALAKPGAPVAPDLTVMAGFDAAEAQLPYDIVACPPQARDLHSLHRATTWLVVELAAADRWTNTPEQLRSEVRGWLQQTPAGEYVKEHAQRGQDLAWILDARGAARLAAFVRCWRSLALALDAIAAGGMGARGAKTETARLPRSVDYGLAALDLAPMAVALAACVVLWGVTGWTSGSSAFLFVFLSLSFSLGAPGPWPSTIGVLVWIAIACALALVYQLGLLPLANSFATLIALLALAVLPLGLLLAMSPVGVVVLANFFGILALRNGHTPEGVGSTEIAAGALAGCLMGVAAVGLLRFDREGLRAFRLERAARRDLCDIATSRRLPTIDRLASLGVDRAAIRKSLPDAPEVARVLGPVWLALDLARLRTVESDLPQAPRELIQALRGAVAFEFGDGFPPLQTRVLAEETLMALVSSPPSPARAQAMSALAGLRRGLPARTAGEA